MPQDVSFDDIAGIIDFMYYGEVAVPTQDISRFLAVAEQFQVRGLVEDVPMVSRLNIIHQNVKYYLIVGSSVQQQTTEQETETSQRGSRT